MSPHRASHGKIARSVRPATVSARAVCGLIATLGLMALGAGQARGQCSPSDLDESHPKGMI